MSERTLAVPLAIAACALEVTVKRVSARAGVLGASVSCNMSTVGACRPAARAQAAAATQGRNGTSGQAASLWRARRTRARCQCRHRSDSESDPARPSVLKLRLSLKLSLPVVAVHRMVPAASGGARPGGAGCGLVGFWGYFSHLLVDRGR